MTKFSVLLSVYQKSDPQHFSEAMQSIWSAQTLQPNEIVLVRDGPLTDALNAEIEKQKNIVGAELTLVPLETHAGVGTALAAGLKVCSCDIVARMDTDDIAHPDRFRKQISFLEDNPDVDIVGSAVTEFDDDPTVITSTRHVPLRHAHILQFAKLRSPFNHTSVMFKKDAARNAGNYRKLLLMEDYDLWVRMLLNGAIAANINEPLVNVRRGISMLERRRGYRYAINEYRLQKTFYQIGFLTFWETCRNLSIRMPVRLLPTFALKLIYRLIRLQHRP